MAAEIFGTVASAAGLVNNCLDVFSKIQSARHFDRNYQRKLVKLDVAKERLVRWGQAMGINYDDPRPQRIPPILESPRVSQVIKALLENIELLFEEVKKSSKRYSIEPPPEDSSPDIDRKARRGSQSRQSLVGNFTQRVTWALLDEQTFGERINEISGFIDDLEKLCPVDMASRTTVAVELESGKAVSHSELTPSSSKEVAVGESYNDSLESETGTIETADSYQESRESQGARQSYTNVPRWPSFASGPPLLDNPQTRQPQLDPGPRRASEPALQDFSHNPSKSKARIFRLNEAIAGVVAAALDRKWLAYLVGSSVHLFNVYPELEVESVVSIGISRTILLPTVTTNQWKDIAVAGNYLAAWGRCRTTLESLLHVTFLPSDSTRQLNPLEVDLRRDRSQIAGFDQHKRVAISHLGFVALIKGSDIYIIAIKSGERMESQYIVPKINFKAIDIAFNQDGDILFAWTMGTKKAALFSWKVSHTSDPVPKSEGYYECETNEGVLETKLFPYNSRLGCVVGASGANKFFPAVIKPPKYTKSLKRNVSRALEQSRVVAARMFNNRHFITVERDRNWPSAFFRIRQYPVRYGSSTTHSIEGGRELYRLVRKPSIGSQLGIFRASPAGNVLLLLVCHLDGFVEAVKVPDSSLTG